MIRIVSSAGFTLLELVVVFSVISILSTIGIASFVSYSNSQVLQGSVSDLISKIHLAQANAASQVKPSAYCLPSDVLNGYGININTSPNGQGNYTYSMYVECNATAYTMGSSSSLPKGVQFESYPIVTTTNNIFFPVLTGGVAGSGMISLTGYNLSKCIIIDSSGVISQQSVSCSKVTLSPTPTP